MPSSDQRFEDKLAARRIAARAVTFRLPRGLLALECLALFVLAPLSLWIVRPPIFILVPLWIIAAGCLLNLLLDPRFDKKRFWNARELRARLKPVLLRFAPIGAAVIAATALFWPQHLFALPRERPWFWLGVLVMYPLVSVYPQGIVYRAFFMHRYRRLFGEGALMLALATLAFGVAHVAFDGLVTVALTTAGGLLFARTYQKTDSLLVAAIEHSLYGCLLFTVGLGSLIYYDG